MRLSAAAWRRKRDSNPRGLAPKRFSRPPRYDRFDIPAYVSILLLNDTLSFFRRSPVMTASIFPQFICVAIISRFCEKVKGRSRFLIGIIECYGGVGGKAPELSAAKVVQADGSWHYWRQGWCRRMDLGITGGKGGVGGKQPLWLTQNKKSKTGCLR